LNKVALVTGASAGLGVEFARQLSKRGHRLVLAARRKERLEELAKKLGNARAVAIDLSKANAALKLMDDLTANGETVDLLVNNAGFGLIGQFAELDAKRERIARGEGTPAELRDSARRKGESDLVRDARELTYADLKRVMAVASPAERKELETIYYKKRLNLVKRNPRLAEMEGAGDDE